MSKGVVLPLDFFQRIEVVALRSLLPREQCSTCKLAAVRVWLCWGRAGAVVQDWAEGSRFVNFLWADLESLGVFMDAKAMMDALAVAGMVIVSPDGTAVLAGYDELNRHLDPLFVDPQRKGGHLRHWKKHRKQADEDAQKRVFLEAVSDMPLDFGSEAPSVDERTKAVSVVFGVQVALNRTVADPSRDELTAALCLLRKVSAERVEDGLRTLAEHRARPDVVATEVIEALRSFEAITAALSGQG